MKKQISSSKFETDYTPKIGDILICHNNKNMGQIPVSFFTLQNPDGNDFYCYMVENHLKIDDIIVVGEVYKDAHVSLWHKVLLNNMLGIMCDHDLSRCFTKI